MKKLKFDFKASSESFRCIGSCRQERAGILQIGRIEAFCEPGVKVTQRLSIFSTRILLLMKKLEARPDAQFPGFCPLFLRDVEGLGEAVFCLNQMRRAAGR